MPNDGNLRSPSRFNREVSGVLRAYHGLFKKQNHGDETSVFTFFHGNLRSKRTQRMARPVQNAAVCRVNSRVDVLVLSLLAASAEIE